MQSKKRTLYQWLSYIEQLHSTSIELGLERIKRVANIKQLATFACPVVTIAGTNGKGSCVAFLESILLTAGYRVGAYTSPHLLRYNERIRINGQMATDEALCSAFSEIEQLRTTTSLSFFEFTTLAALYLFQQAKLDCILLEVGLGGRLDAVNIVDPTIAVITSIDIDHVEWLGPTREAIGREKAGIMRYRGKVVCGDPNIPKSILQQANMLEATLYRVGYDFKYKQNDEGWFWQSPHCFLDNLPPLYLPMQNAATALMVIVLLKSFFKLSKTAIYDGLKNAWLPGRFQIIHQPVTTIFDVAHNPASATLLAEKLKILNKTPFPIDFSQSKLLAVVGMLADKDIEQTFKPLAKLVDSWYIGSLHLPRGAEAFILAQALAVHNVHTCYCFDSVEEAYSQALANSSKQDRIIVFGSFHTVAAIQALTIV